MPEATLSPAALTDDPDFQKLVPWAKAFAKWQRSTHLLHEHFLMAALYLHEKGEWLWPTAHVEAMRAAVPSQTTQTPAGTVALEPASQTMPLSADLKDRIAIGAGTPFVDWMLGLAQWTSSMRDIEQALVLDSNPEPIPEIPAPAIDWEGIPGATELRPWFSEAVRLLRCEALDTPAVAVGVVKALRAGALDGHLDLRHFCAGHADELRFWVEHSGQWVDAAEGTDPGDSSSIVVASQALTKASESLKANFKTPNVLWNWIHCAVKDSNDYARELQIAHHEAGHAVAIHLLIPEGIYQTITIVPEAGSGGHVTHDRNDGFDQVYLNSLEQVMELAVIALAGRAAEERRFGKMRADSGASADMALATHQCWRAITMFGLDPVFGMLTPSAVTTVPPDMPRFLPMAASGWLHDLAQQRLHVWIHWAQREAKRLVNQHWGLVESLAEELMRRKSLNNHEAREILCKTGPLPVFNLQPVDE